jgi:hypothetical protein
VKKRHGEEEREEERGEEREEDMRGIMGRRRARRMEMGA